MAKNKPWYGKVSKPFLGFLADNGGISGNIAEAGDNDVFFVTAVIDLNIFTKLCGCPKFGFGTITKPTEPVWEFFPGHYSNKHKRKIGDGNMFWTTLMAGYGSGGDQVFMVKDEKDDEHVYLFHTSCGGMTYHLGRLHKDTEFRRFVLRRLNCKTLTIN